MSAFLGDLQVKFDADERRSTLTAPLEFDSDVLKRTLIVPVGFDTDFASVPKIFWNILPPTGSYGRPAVVHDYLYWLQAYPRDVCDQVLLEGMTCLNVGWCTRHTIYRAVRLFGFKAWNEHAADKVKQQAVYNLRLPQGWSGQGSQRSSHS